MINYRINDNDNLSRIVFPNNGAKMPAIYLSLEKNISDFPFKGLIFNCELC